MSAPTVCVFTPTYNRAYRLANLYHSLLNQTCFDFTWLIVDDGSSDSTESLVAGMIAEAKIDIEYYKQPNGGKQRAHNTGVNVCKNELFFCVDSDDVLTPDAIRNIVEKWSTVSSDPCIAGIIALCGKNESTPLTSIIPGDLEVTTRWDLYYKTGFKGDTASVYRTDILRKYPFWVAEGEKFIAETYVYHQIDQQYCLATMNVILTICEYLEDGYSHNARAVTKNNPIGYMVLKRMFIEYSDTLYLKLYNSILYMVGCILSNTRKGITNAPYPWIAFLAYLPAQLLCHTVYR